MTAARPSEPARPVGATPVGGGNRGGGRRRGLLVGAALLAILLLAALLLSQCGSDDADGDPASSTGSGSASSTSEGTGGATGGSATASPSAGGGTAAGAGQIRTADGWSVLELAASADGAAALAGVTGQPVTGTAVQVLSVPADEGFWVGTSEAERVWVQLTGEAGESPYQVTEGDSVDFQGTVAAHAAGFAAQVGVDDAEGAAMLDGLGQHLEVAKSAVTLSE